MKPSFAKAGPVRHARILLLADTAGPEGGSSDSPIASAAHTSIPSVERVRRVCVEHGLERALERKDPERDDLRKLDGQGEAQLLARCCGPAPEGHAREAYESERNGVAAIFCAVAPHVGWRRIEERERKTRTDYAHGLRALCDGHFAGAEKIVLVQDNLNTHSPASLDEAFPPAEAARLRARFEFASLRSPCGLPAAGYLAALGSLHAQARELAEHRRDRTQCADARLPRPTHPGPHRTCPRTRRVGA